MSQAHAIALTGGARTRGPAARAPVAKNATPREVSVNESACSTEGCRRRARVCRECVRALAFKWWGAIARHNIGGSRCELCEHAAEAAYCAEHALDAVLEHRALMRELGHRIGEPPPPAVIELVDRGCR